MYNFIDWLKLDKVREAYLSGSPSFIVSSDLNRIFWVNGSCLPFFGASLIGDLIGAPTGFDRATKSQIEAGQKTERSVQLRGIKGRCNFIISPVVLENENALLATAVLELTSQYDRLPLIAGLSDKGTTSAIVTVKGEPLLASSDYDLMPEQLGPQLENLNIGQSHQGEIIENTERYVYGAVRLDEIHFLIIGSIKHVEIQSSRGNLSDDERFAFREIAERLKNEKETQLPHESALPEAAAIALPVNLQDLSTLLDLATDGVIFLDRDLAIRSITNSAEGLFSSYDNILIGQLLTASLTPESVGRLIAYRADVDRHAFLNKGCMVNLSGDLRTVSITLIKLETGGYAAILHEKGAKNHQENFEELRVAVTNKAEDNEIDKTMLSAVKKIFSAEEKMPKELPFLASVAHEIRTPLNAIVGFAELMRDEKFGKIDNLRYQEYLRDMVLSGHHILSLVNDLLVQSKTENEGLKEGLSLSLEEKKRPLELKAISLGNVIRDVVSLLQEQANKDGIIVRISLEIRLPNIWADERAVRQIILNLLSNAIRFTAKGGQIILSASRDEKLVVFRIRDTGVGMSVQEIARAMRPYEQIKPKELRHDDATFLGTGLGLPLTKAIIEENDATFSITSEEKAGTVVEICFKRADIPDV